MVPPGSDRVSRARPYSGASSIPEQGCAYGALTLCRRPSHAVRLPLSGGRPARQDRGMRPYNPRGGKAGAHIRSRVWPRSPFARRYSGSLVVDFLSSGYLDVSVPPVVLPPAMCSPGGCRHCWRRVRPFGDPGIVGRVPLPRDYRSLPRPSSAPCAKASAVRPGYLPAHRRAGRRILYRTIVLGCHTAAGRDGPGGDRLYCNLLVRFADWKMYLFSSLIEESIRSV